MNRFWVKDEEQFKKECAQTLGHSCSFCGGKLESYHEEFEAKEE
jgi:hypothetical protein